jgi:hypothetical protein
MNDSFTAQTEDGEEINVESRSIAEAFARHFFLFLTPFLLVIFHTILMLLITIY